MEEAGEDDYESLGRNSSVGQHMLAGACAGIMEHTLVYPVDCVKTRLQCLQPLEGARYRGLVHGLRTLIATEGLARSLRGLGSVLAGAGPAHALYFSCYEMVKAAGLRRGVNDRLSYGLSAVCATVLHDAIMTPADAVKQRVQVYCSPYANSWQCARSVLQAEGAGALYRAYGTQLLMNIPFHVAHFSAYELGQDALNPQRQYLPHTHVLAGAFAGACAAAITNPLDVCKTLLNTQERCALRAANLQSVGSFLSAAKLVYRQHGLLGYLRGVQARIVFQMPGTAISWFVYEAFKWHLGCCSNASAVAPPPPPPPSSSPSSSSAAAAAAAAAPIGSLVIEN